MFVCMYTGAKNAWHRHQGKNDRQNAPIPFWLAVVWCQLVLVPLSGNQNATAQQGLALDYDPRVPGRKSATRGSSLERAWIKWQKPGMSGDVKPLQVATV